MYIRYWMDTSIVKEVEEEAHHIKALSAYAKSIKFYDNAYCAWIARHHNQERPKWVNFFSSAGASVRIIKFYDYYFAKNKLTMFCFKFFLRYNEFSLF